MRQQERIILGVDPGTQVMGYGVLRIFNNKPEMLAIGILKLSAKDDHYLKLKKIYDFILGLVEEHLPDELAIEAPFFGKNVQSMLKLGRAQGVAMAAALARDIPVFEYAPLKIKMSLTGNGKAAKEQVAYMVQNYLKIPQEKMLKELDATDGMAAALCHYFQTNKLNPEKQFTSWKDFINKNPSKVKITEKTPNSK